MYIISDDPNTARKAGRHEANNPPACAAGGLFGDIGKRTFKSPQGQPLAP